LVGFLRVMLEPGAVRRVTVPLPPRAFSFWSTASHSWQVVAGERTVHIAASSRDVRLTGRVPSP
jgi:beta-glucosidase